MLGSYDLDRSPQRKQGRCAPPLKPVTAEIKRRNSQNRNVKDRQLKKD